MKRLSLSIVFALLTFCLGVGLTLTYLRISQPSLITSQQVTPSSKESHGEAVKIMLKRTFTDQRNRLIAEFEAVNGSSEVLYYSGSSAGSNPSQSVMRGNRSESYTPACGVGRTEQVILPGKSVLFQVYVGEREAGNIKMGFDFYLKGGDRQIIKAMQTIWSDNVYVPEP